ncbi:MAG: DNA polymerase/3'-5' exonuclease PolX [Candidatus Thermoplasmatota archaeon]|nr:DNA polymerase/3'-5' exonuclease PolX [Candidatus Thermoplasmatota archaeon]
MKNKLVADIFYRIADLLDVNGEMFFKTRAYRKAAQTIETLDEDIEIVSKEKRLQSIPGIGESLAKKINEIVETDRLEYFEKLKKETPEGVIDLLEILGLGPKKVSALYRNLSISNIGDLKEACNKGKLRNLEGFGEITERNILRGITLREKTSGRVLLNVAYEYGNNYIEYLKKCKKIEKISIAGSLRRMRETIGDLDILASSDAPDEVMDYFVKYHDVQRVLLKGSTKTSVLLNDDLQVDLRVVKEKNFGAALQYFTGSKEHNVKMRSIAIKKNLKLNEYGLFDKKTGEYIVGRTEKEVYNKLDLAYVEPELRENRGEIETTLKGELPDIVKYSDIKGDLHVHSKWSDGADSIEDIATKAQILGYEYVGIADHSQSLKIARGLTEERIDKKIKEIDNLNKKLSDFRILCGTECDIKPDGSLDYDNRILKKFDFVGIGIHTSFKMNEKEATERIIKGMENKHVDFLAHPTCRIIGRREPFELDMEKIFDAAVETDTYLEINSFPDRLDLNDANAKFAKERGAKFVIGTDSHNVKNLPFMRFGIATARRGWLNKNDILNTSSLKNLVTIIGCD